MQHHRKAATPVVATIVAAGLLLAACGSSGSSGSDEGSTGGSTSAVDVDKVYAEGVPTLTELYKGTETAPPTTGPAMAKDKTVIFVSCGQASPGCAGVPNAMKEPAELVGWNFKIIDGQLNANNGWANGIRQAIAAKPDAIVIHGMNCPDVQQPVQDAVDAGIPVMGLEDVDCDDPLLPGGGGKALFSVPMSYGEGLENGADYFAQWGATAAQYLVNATRGKAKVIQTVYQPVFGAHQKVGQDDVLKKCGGCEVVAKIEFGPADQVPNGPLVQKFNTVLAQHPEANAVLTNFDTVLNTAGVAKAIVDSGRKDKLVVVGGEGYAQAQQLVKADQGINGEAAHDGVWMAWGAVDNLNRFFNGEPAAPQGVGFRVIDAENNLSPAGKDYTSPIDYKSAYKKLWKVSS
jgi:ribose transport system substrate-binding protein